MNNSICFLDELNATRFLGLAAHRSRSVRCMWNWVVSLPPSKDPSISGGTFKVAGYIWKIEFAFIPPSASEYRHGLGSSRPREELVSLFFPPPRPRCISVDFVAALSGQISSGEIRYIVSARAGRMHRPILSDGDAWLISSRVSPKVKDWCQAAVTPTTRDHHSCNVNPVKASKVCISPTLRVPSQRIALPIYNTLRFCKKVSDNLSFF